MDAQHPLFVTVPCPVCAQSEFDVIRRAEHASNVSEAELRAAYSASSKASLLDQVVRCRECGMKYVNPMPRADLVIAGYEEGDDATFVSQNEGRIRTFDAMLRRVLAQQGKANGKGLSYLDVGCAGGASLVAARALGFATTGVEPNHYLAAYGRNTYQLDVRDGILEDGTFPDASFDWITMWDVLEHVPQPGDVLRTINRIMKPGGTLIVSYPDVGSTVARMLGRRWPFWLSVHLHYYERPTIARQLAGAGFDVAAQWSYWNNLEFAYVLDRAGDYFSLFKGLRNIVARTPLGTMNLRYNAGQTLVVARKRP